MSAMNHPPLLSRYSDARYECGCDEAGAGPLAGALYAAAVLLPREAHLSGLNDSKKLTHKKRELLYDQIRDQADGRLYGRFMDIVHQDNGTVGKIPVHNRVIVRVRVHQRPVLSIQRPHEERLLYNIKSILVCRSVGRPGNSCRLSAGLHQRFVRSLELGADLL